MSLLDKIDSVKKRFLADIENFPLENDKINHIKSSYLGRKGEVANLFLMLSSVDRSEKPKIGAALNHLKKELNTLFQKKLEENSNSKINKANSLIDLTLPGTIQRYGSKHILEQTLQEIKEIFTSIGFHVAYGPEVDDEYHNFSALNIPEHHPSRDMQDTFFINPTTILRSHTSNVQVHLMENEDPPIRYIVPGRVYRNEAISYKSYCLFHQVEGIYINEKVSFAELKGCLEYFIKRMFGDKKKMRFRPSFFPFTEPSAEVDIWDEERNQWMEILGCGMVDPAVLDNVGYDSQQWRGYAFGMGVERMAMLKYNINDIRLFYNGDIRFMSQFS